MPTPVLESPTSPLTTDPVAWRSVDVPGLLRTGLIILGLGILPYKIWTGWHHTYFDDLCSAGLLLAQVFFLCWSGTRLNAWARRHDLSPGVRLATIVLIGLAVRVFMWRNFPYWGGSDADDYAQHIAPAILENGLLAAPVIRPVGASLLFALSFLPFGPGELGPIVVNLLCSALSMVLIARILIHITGSWNMGMAGAWFFAFHTRSLAFSRITNSEEIAVAFLIITLYWYFAYRDSGSWRDYILTFFFGFLGMHVRYSMGAVIATVFLIDLAIPLLTTLRAQARRRMTPAEPDADEPMRGFLRPIATKAVLVTLLFVILIIPWFLKIHYHDKMPGFLAASENTMLYVGNNPYADGTGRYDMLVLNHLIGEAKKHGVSMKAPGNTQRFQGILAKEYIKDAPLSRHAELVQMRAKELFLNPTWYRGTQYEKKCTYLMKFLLLGVYLVLLPFALIMRRKKEAFAFFFLGFLVLLTVAPPLLTVGAPRYFYPAEPMLLMAILAMFHAIAKSSNSIAAGFTFDTATSLLLFAYLTVGLFLLPTTIAQYRYDGATVQVGASTSSSVAQSFHARKAHYTHLELQRVNLDQGFPHGVSISVHKDVDGVPESAPLQTIVVPASAWMAPQTQNSFDRFTVGCDFNLVAGQRYWLVIAPRGNNIARLATGNLNPLHEEKLLFRNSGKWWEPFNGAYDLYFVLS